MNMATNTSEQNASSTPPVTSNSPPKFLQPPPSITPSTFNMPPPNLVGAAGMNSVANPYSHQYYQQYMHYMYSSMYSHPSYIQAYGISQANPAAAAAMQNYYNYSQNSTSGSVPITSVPPPPVVNNNQSVINQSKPVVNNDNSQKQAIKINLKFQQNNESNGVEADSKTENKANAVKKSRFNTSIDSLSNVKQQQEIFNKKQENEVEKKTNDTISNTIKSTPSTTATESSTSAVSTTKSDIVYDINKWPASLKEYCAKVYQHYQSITIVAEDQVTKYLQQRITNAFKLKPDLNIGWENEPLPDIISIKKVAPFSNMKQIQQQKQMAIKNPINKPTTNQTSILQQQQKKPLFLPNSVKTNVTPSKPAFLKEDLATKNVKPIKKSDSSTSSSTSSSSSSSSSSRSTTSTSSSSESNDEDDNYIKLTNKNLNKKSLSIENNLSKFSGKRRVDNDLTNNNKFNKKLKKNGDNNLISRKFTIENNNFTISQKKNIKNIFELEKEHNEDLKEIENLKKHGIIVGTSMDLEKEYLRLTAAPDPAIVRPLYVLKKSFNFVLDKYNKTNDYRYICDQLKAIRQDLTVQVIQNEFTIEVYETHARIAIKNKDRDEFNQCQSQLKTLYEMVKCEKTGKNNSAEFAGYRLIYNMMTKSYKDLNQVIKEIKSKYSDNDYLKHLLELNNAWYLNNYVKFFHLYLICNEMTKYLIELFIERERKLALKAIIKSYRPHFKIDKIKELLAYESVEKCESELLSYKLNVQRVSSVGPDSSNNLVKLEQSCDSFDLVLDCKSCNIQNL